MTVGELIKTLASFDPELIVEIEGCCHIFEAAEVVAGSSPFNTVLPGTVLIEHGHDLIGDFHAGS
jgi:hypothetical protein